MRIAVCSPQVPFARGGAEILSETLVGELRARGHKAELVTIPFKWYPGAESSPRRCSGGSSTSRRSVARRSTS